MISMPAQSCQLLLKLAQLRPQQLHFADNVAVGMLHAVAHDHQGTQKLLQLHCLLLNDSLLLVAAPKCLLQAGMSPGQLFMLLTGCLDASLGGRVLVLLLHKKVADVLDVSLRSCKSCLQLPCTLDKTCKRGIVSQILLSVSYMMHGMCVEDDWTACP